MKQREIRDIEATNGPDSVTLHPGYLLNDQLLPLLQSSSCTYLFTELDALNWQKLEAD